MNFGNPRERVHDRSTFRDHNLARLHRVQVMGQVNLSVLGSLPNGSTLSRERRGRQPTRNANLTRRLSVAAFG
jgi:hypothetical protein